VAGEASCGGGDNQCLDGACDDCGGDEQICCFGSCQMGYACVDFECESCGADGEACCADRQCDEGVCIGNGGDARCEVGCGAPNQNCCSSDGPDCQPGLDCSQGDCEGTVCGLPGIACCDDFGDDCVVSGYGCIADVCQACGGLDQPCCPTFPACGFNLDCSGGTCEPD
jgi:hypothetical protein